MNFCLARTPRQLCNFSFIFLSEQKNYQSLARKTPQQPSQATKVHSSPRFGYSKLGANIYPLFLACPRHLVGGLCFLNCLKREASFRQHRWTSLSCFFATLWRILSLMLSSVSSRFLIRSDCSDTCRSSCSIWRFCTWTWPPQHSYQFVLLWGA